jgi:hypothetical protein
MLRKKPERTLELDEELNACFVQWQKAFYREKWTELAQILRKPVSTGVKQD